MSPASRTRARSSVVHPSVERIEARPGMVPPVGKTPTVRTPLVRATGITTESGLTATYARTSGVIGPTSLWSRVARTAEVSSSPRLVTESMSPG